VNSVCKSAYHTARQVSAIRGQRFERSAGLSENFHHSNSCKFEQLVLLVLPEAEVLVRELLLFGCPTPVDNYYKWFV